ncbi:hypothetical protein EDC04DRAFT_2601097 [Pisolithus marmoratus]|nr:hypothetical protein EDC04DRAFT_2601097 [Pisolithus marmoratus]
MPKVSKLASHPSICCKASSHADNVVEHMAQWNALYLQLFDQHADFVRGKEVDEVTNVYHRVMSRGIISDSTSITDDDLDALEHILHTPTATLNDYVFVSLTAHNLLLSQMEVMKKLSYNMMGKVDVQTIELRSLSRDRNSVLEQEKCAFLTPPSTLPKLERLPISHCALLTNATVHNILQYEDVSYPSEDVSIREMEERLMGYAISCCAHRIHVGKANVILANSKFTAWVTTAHFTCWRF